MKPTSLPHLVAYIGGALLAGVAWLANQSPGSFLFLGPKAAGYASAAIGLAGAVVVFAHQTGWIPSKPSDKVTTIANALIPLVLILPLLHGCATLTKIENAIGSPAAQPYLIAAADVAVATAEAKGVSAAQITGIAQKALAADSGTAASLATIAAVANAQIAKLGLPAGDVAAAQILEAALTVAIQAQIGNNASIAQAQSAIAVVLNAIIAAANPGVVSAPSSSPTAFVSPADMPARNTHFVLAAVESPTVVGSAAGLVLVASLQAFAHVSVAVPVAAAITVLFTVSAAAIDNLIS